MIEALRVVSAEEVSMEKGAPQPKLSVEFLKQQLKKLGKEKGENLLENDIETILKDCKLVHEDSMIIEDFAKYLISRWIYRSYKHINKALETWRGKKVSTQK